MCPVKVRRVDGYQVSHDGTVSAKSTTKAKAEGQARLLRGIAHGMVPRGAKARTVKPISTSKPTSRGSRSRSRR